MLLQLTINWTLSNIYSICTSLEFITFLCRVVGVNICPQSKYLSIVHIVYKKCLPSCYSLNILLHSNGGVFLFTIFTMNSLFVVTVEWNEQRETDILGNWLYKCFGPTLKHNYHWNEIRYGTRCCGVLFKTQSYNALNTITNH